MMKTLQLLNLTVLIRLERSNHQLTLNEEINLSETFQTTLLFQQILKEEYQEATLRSMHVLREVSDTLNTAKALKIKNVDYFINSTGTGGYYIYMYIHHLLV